MRLRGRFMLHGLAATAYLGGVVATAAFVAVPALRRVDRSLAPLQSVFAAIDQRQRQLVSDIDQLDRVLNAPPAAGQRPPSFSGAGVHAPASLVSIYGGLLTPGAARTLAVAEDELGAIESAFGEALARYETGDHAGARAKIAELRRAEDQSQRHYNEAMMLALRTGVEARDAFRDSMVTLGWAAIAWIVIGILLVVAITWDVSRHIWRPIHALDRGVRQIAEGNWSQPVPVNTADELGELAAQFNALTDTLQRRAGQHAQLATAGELMAGVAHELNNPLQAIRGTAELKSNSGDATGRDWGTVLAQAERASKLARDLVRFVRPVARDVRLLSLNEVVMTAVDLIEFQYRADGVGLELDLAQALPSVRADSHELVQVIVNLLGNAHHVLSRANGPRRVFVRTWAEAGRVHCRILDTGPGVASEVRERLFSPFFSTKEVGVGLGLTVSRNLVRGAGGELTLDDGGPGASFTLWLPAIEKAAESAPMPAPHDGNQAMPLKGVSVLIADDEEAIRGVLERFFQRDGATVIGVAGGVAALDAIRRRTVDVIVLDVRMPDKDGAEVYRELRKERPELAGRVIFLSGDVSRVTEELDVPENRVLVKPVELGDLKRAVMATLAGMSSTFSLR